MNSHAKKWLEFAPRIEIVPEMRIGHLELTGTGDIVLVQGQATMLSNAGTITVSGTGKREIFAHVVNGSGGVFDLDHRSVDFNGHDFEQQAGGTLSLDIDESQTSQLSVNVAELAGTIAIRTSTATATGHQRIIDASTRSGTFDATTFSGPEWTVGYDATGVFLDPAPISTTSSSTTTSTTSTAPTTTLLCTSARCILDAAGASLACDGQTIPTNVSAKITKAESLIDAAASSSTSKARKLLKRAKKALRQAAAKATRATKGKTPKLSAECAAAIKDAANVVGGSL
jgi:hypothetical protein